LKRRLLIALTCVLMLALLVPLSVSAAPPEGKGPANNFQVVTKTGVKGVTLMGPPMRGTKPVASTGTIGAGGGGTGYAVIVGIADYPGPDDIFTGGLDLSYCAADAQLMAYTLMAVYGYQPQNIAVLTDQDASRDAILAAIADMGAQAGPDDEVVFFFSGHGVKFTPKLNATSGGGKVGILTWGWENPENPYEAYPEMILDRELKAAFGAFQTDRQVFILDCCVGASFSEIAGQGSVVIAASGQAGTAMEDLPSWHPGYLGIEHGLFTYFLAAAGMLGGAADLNGDSFVTIEEAYDFTRATLMGMNQQIPDLWQVPAISDQYKGDLLLGAQ
jgi:metacaspase-1